MSEPPHPCPVCGGEGPWVEEWWTTGGDADFGYYWEPCRDCGYTPDTDPFDA